MDNQEFESIVRQAADEKSTSILPNSSVDRSIIVMSHIFRTTKNIVKIYGHDLGSPICKSEKYRAELKHTIKENNATIQVLLSSEPDKNSSAYQMLQELKADPKYTDKIEIKTITPNGAMKLKEANINNGDQFFFAVADSRMYRFETNTKTRSAYFCFNDEKRAKKLERIFSIGWQ